MILTVQAYQSSIEV